MENTMITKDEWARFARAVPVGTKIRFDVGADADDETIWIEGTLLENYPHFQEAHIASITDPQMVDTERRGMNTWPMLRFECADRPLTNTMYDTYMAEYMSFNIWEGWYSMTDILMSDEDDWDENDPQMGPKFVGRNDDNAAVSS
jgi:hypothetical protein